MQNRRVSIEGAEIPSQLAAADVAARIGTQNDLAFAIRNWNDIGRVMAPKAEEASASRKPFLVLSCCLGRPMRARNSLLYLYCTFECHLPNTPNSFE